MQLIRNFDDSHPSNSIQIRDGLYTNRMFFSLPLNTHVNVSFFDQHQKTKSRLAYTSGVKKRTSYLFALILLAALLVLLALLTWRSPSAGRLVVPAHPANTRSEEHTSELQSR